VRPVLFVTNHVPPDRLGAFAALHARTGLELALFGGRSHHATAGAEDPGIPHRHVTERQVHALAASGRFRAVVCGTAGRRALPAAFTGARRSRTPFVLWTALWHHHPRTLSWRLAGTPLLQAVYRGADAVAAYGPHVADFARRHGARRVVVAPQAVDGAFWGAAGRVEHPGYTVVFVGRDTPSKGLALLERAWKRAHLPVGATLHLVGTGPQGPVPAQEVRNFLAKSDVLALPALVTKSFVEPWGLVVNEAMHAGLPTITSDAVGAAAGGLARHERNGLVVPAGDEGALAAALERLADDPALRARLGAAARRDVAPYTYDAWAAGMARALDLATSRRPA
jgi:glycosyltransferase involved in cell wall biosynthesis